MTPVDAYKARHGGTGGAEGTHSHLAGKLDYAVVQQCMHCGMCLPTCPTYDTTGLERNSPRGRIAWMRAIADGEMSVDQAFAGEMYYCLGCLACTTACPAGVDYPQLFEAARADIEESGVANGGQRDFWRWLTVKTLFMHPRLLRLVGRGLWLHQKLGFDRFLRRVNFFGLLPRRLRELEPQTPRVCDKFSHQLVAPVEAPKGGVRYRVGLLTGCVQDLAFSDINRDTADVLLANGCEVTTPPVQPCCGSLHAHNGELELARQLARRMITLLPPEKFDAIISNAGGCGSHLRHYGELLKDDPDWAERGHEWDRKCKDIHEWLVGIDFEAPKDAPGESRTEGHCVTYHESCHLCHGQKVKTQPRKILKSLPGVNYVELPESDWCCGSAGIYNITQPEQAGKLQKRKVGHIAKTSTTTVATANPGCHLQLVNGLREASVSMEVRHPISLLAEAYRKSGQI